MMDVRRTVMSVKTIDVWDAAPRTAMRKEKPYGY